MSAAWEPKVGDEVEGWPVNTRRHRGRVLGVCGEWLWVQPFDSSMPVTWDASRCIPLPSLLETAGALIERYGSMMSFRGPAWDAFVAAYERAKEEEEE